MNRSRAGKILTTHVGSLPDPGPVLDGTHDDALIRAAVEDGVKFQKSIGLDVINEGEYTKGGDWLRYVETRLSGFEPMEIGSTVIDQGLDREVFAQFYRDFAENQGISATRRPRGRRNWQCVAPLAYRGQDDMKRAIDMFKSTLAEGDEGFITAVAPGSLEPYRQNVYYKSHEEFLYALAEALSVEYRMIVDAGLLLQVDDAWLAALWERIGMAMGLEAFQKYCMLRVDVLNHALKGIPADRVRYHMCWGSWHGPHMYDLPLKDIVDVLLRVNAGAYLIEGANPRHEHEFLVWETVKLPEGKILVPGVISHATAVVEHPELVAYRIKQYVRLLGAENVIAGADCGFGGRAHPQVGKAKLRALVEGAALV